MSLSIRKATPSNYVIAIGPDFGGGWDGGNARSVFLLLARSDFPVSIALSFSCYAL